MTITRRLDKFLLMALVALCACARAGSAQAPSPTPAPRLTDDSTRKRLVEPGFGTLKQDEFTLGIRSGDLLVKVTPLDEQVIRLAAPDTYNRLRALADSRRASATKTMGGTEPELFLVSFFSYQPNVTFQPEDVQIEYNGRMLRAGAIIPLTPTWGKQLMGQQETQAGIYAFDEIVDFQLPLKVKYGIDEADWQRVIPKLEIERSKIKARQQKPQ